MKIYFAGSIRGGREDKVLYQQIISFLTQFGTVFTEHIGDENLTDQGDEGVSDRFIHDRDMEWLTASEVVIAEVTTVSMGVGYEIGRAVSLGKKVLCLYRPLPGKRLSAMIAGCPEIAVSSYSGLEEAENIITRFFRNTDFNLKTY
jgi:2'-deoxynucleoside 5'-phosphate N-hydrolase